MCAKRREGQAVTKAVLRGKPGAGNPHVRFDEGEVASAATPRRESLLCKTAKNEARCIFLVAAAASCVILSPNAASSAFAEGAVGNTTIVSADGAATIVIPMSATPVQKYAAEELRDWTEKMTGVRLPIADDSGTLPKRAVIIGRTRFTEKLLADPKFDVRKLGDDGYRLVARGKRLFVVGDGVRAAIYGVYGLLEDYGGCRWFTFDCSYVPKRKTLALRGI